MVAACPTGACARGPCGANTQDTTSAPNAAAPNRISMLIVLVRSSLRHGFVRRHRGGCGLGFRRRRGERPEDEQCRERNQSCDRFETHFHIHLRLRCLVSLRIVGNWLWEDRPEITNGPECQEPEENLEWHAVYSNLFGLAFHKIVRPR